MRGRTFGYRAAVHRYIAPSRGREGVERWGNISGENIVSGLHAHTQPEDAKDVEEANVYCGASSGHVLDGEVEHESTCGCDEI